VQAKVAFAGISYRGTAPDSDPFLTVLKDGALFIRLELRPFPRVEVTEVSHPGTVRAGSQAVAATNTLIIIDIHHTIRPFMGGADRTDRNTGRRIAMHAGAGSEVPVNIGKFSHLLV
jgi:hypothetical protein